MMSNEKIERIRKLEALLDTWEKRWDAADKAKNYQECNRIIRKEIDPLRKQLKKELGEKQTMRDQLKIGGMSDSEISVISNEFIKLLLAADYIANVSEEIKSKLKKCKIATTNVGEAIDKVAQAAQAVGDDAVGHHKLRDTPIAMLIYNDFDLLDELDLRLDQYINSSIDKYNKILSEREAEGEEH